MAKGYLHASDWHGVTHSSITRRYLLCPFWGKIYVRSTIRYPVRRYMANKVASREVVESSLEIRSDETSGTRDLAVEPALITSVPLHQSSSFHLFLSLDNHNETARQSAGKEAVGLAPTLQRRRGASYGL